MPIRVRFAPSPTGPLHMGGVRTALFNYLFARKHQGTFILRIEDTDQARFVPGAGEYIMESLEWCGIQVDEGVREGGEYGPYRQSDRKEIYRQYADQLIASGWAYYAFDTAEELEGRRAGGQEGRKTGRQEGRKAGRQEGKDEDKSDKNQGAFAYDSSTRMGLRNSLVLSEEEVRGLLVGGVPYVIRFKMPANEEIVMQDLIRGEVKVDSNTLDDKVLFKSDGMPTYHLANVVDDHLMKISHVIRGEEWLPSLPLHVMLYVAFGWTDTMPQFAHLPLILKPSGNGKLSKRDGDKLGFPVFPINWTVPDTEEVYSGYREAGYFPDAFVNILALLGWNDGTDQELYSMEELIEAFSLERVGKSGSRFDPDKATWFNHQYLVSRSDEEIAEEFLMTNDERRMKNGVWSRECVVKIMSLVKERVDFVKDLWDQAYFFFEAPTEYDEQAVKKRWKEDTPAMLRGVIEVLNAGRGEPSAGELEVLVKGYVADHELNMGVVMNALRLCLVGKPMGPGVFDIISIIGIEETVRRLNHAIDSIG